MRTDSTSINYIQEYTAVEDVVQRYLSASSIKELQESLHALANYIPTIDLEQAFHDHLPVNLFQLSTDKEVPMMSFCLT